MNGRTVEPGAMNEFILGDRQLHARFSTAIEVLARIVIANPRPVAIAALSDAIGQSSRAIRSLLTDLHRSGLLHQDDNNKDAWYCSSMLGTITLADIFRSVASGMPEPSSSRKKRSEPAADEQRSVAQQNVDLLLMQATMEINQVVLQHLQAFDLGRLKALGSSTSVRGFSSGPRPYIPEPAQELA
ncbi:hypothetical protein [Noviherbaspirillum sp.]|uniref:hypothetical protein n=1 Tax=Noviherbaspirillum sp. TaxID=1926288 RepID=UPI0025E9B200|nr:hypothetical protein [Noviherbaspirillum sp.]